MYLGGTLGLEWTTPRKLVEVLKANYCGHVGLEYMHISDIEERRFLQERMEGKDKDIELRTAAQLPDDDVLVVDVLQKMAKQRRESITLYEQGGRQELAEVEKAELAVIEEFLPQQMGEDEVKAAIAAIIAETGAAGMKDMGKVVAALKAKHGSQLDMGKASGLVKAALG